MTANTKVQAFKKNLIIETAKELFTRNSFDAVTVEEIWSTTIKVQSKIARKW